MKTKALCPISPQLIDERVPRLVASFTVLILVIFSITQINLIILFLIFDFLVRGISRSNYSLLAFFSKKIVKLLPNAAKKTNAGPKIFAARIGFVFSMLVFFFSLLEFMTLQYVFIGIFGFFAFLEAVFNFCVACKVYPFVYQFTYKA
ncbi:MAG: DUF4395 domain-containing protein [Paludibacteraceae bacterium]|nr:DUF4395 domain-containing protein [Paludibacteraceae bacterium]